MKCDWLGKGFIREKRNIFAHMNIWAVNSFYWKSEISNRSKKYYFKFIKSKRICHLYIKHTMKKLQNGRQAKGYGINQTSEIILHKNH